MIFVALALFAALACILTLALDRWLEIDDPLDVEEEPEPITLRSGDSITVSFEDEAERK